MKKSAPLLLQLVKAITQGQFYDGTKLGEQLGITRSAVWKMMKKLEQLGVDIESVKGKGYALNEPLILLDEPRMQAALPDVLLDVYESVGSTNACFDVTQPYAKPAVAIAEMQTDGRGRLKRQWLSPFAQNLYCSCMFPLPMELSQLAGLSLVVSLAMVNAIERVTGLNGQLQVKWPNDVFYQQQKLAGTLIEIHAEPHGNCQVIIGMGINVNMLPRSAQALDRPWTSLRQITGQYQDRNDLAIALVQQLQSYIQTFQTTGLAGFTQEWHALDCLADQPITLHSATETISGIARGINALGQLRVELEGGEIHSYAAGDVSSKPSAGNPG